jgi:hypothetical protein
LWDSTVHVACRWSLVAYRSYRARGLMGGFITNTRDRLLVEIQLFQSNIYVLITPIKYPSAFVYKLL